MPDKDESSRTNGLAGRDCVPFFESDKTQIKFEFWYLVILFLLATTTVLSLQLGSVLHQTDKWACFAFLGGLLGGWVYDAKWFYRVTARGKSNQYPFPWQPHKFYWRILTPFLSALVSTAVFFLIAADIFPIQMKNSQSARVAFSVSFVLGYFSDLVLSRLAAWAEQVLPNAKKNG